MDSPYTFSFTAGETRVFRLRERDPLTGAPITVSRHADRYRYITEGGRQGPWDTDFAAYTREPMDVWCLPWVREILLCWAPQSSKTQVSLNCIHHAIDQDPGPILWTAPDENKAKDAVNKKIYPMIAKSARLASLLSPAFRDKTNRSIRFVNGASIQVAWAGSAAQLASDSYKYGIEDETEKYPEFAGKEADPDALIDQRFISYPYTYKKLKCSTPALEDGIIWRAMTEDADEIRDYEARCPICGHFQVMAFDSITWPSDIGDPRLILRKRLAWYCCASCGMKWDERLRNDAVRAGRWRPRVPVPDGRPAVIAYHLPAWYSPFVSFARCVASYIRGQDDPAKHMTFITQIKAEAYTERVDDKKEVDVKADHLSPDLPARTVPASALALMCGIDSHKNYFKFTTWAFDEHLNSTLVDYGILPTLDDVEEYVFNSRFPIETQKGKAAPSAHQSAATMSIWRAGIDIGGGKGKEDEDMTQTAAVKQWLNKVKKLKTVFGIKGASQKQAKMVQFSLIGAGPKGKKARRLEAARLGIYILDTARLKLLVHHRLERRSPGEKQTITFHRETGDDYIRELLAEELHRDRKGDTYWKKIRTANHYLDCTVYAHACADTEWLPSFIQLVPRFRSALAATRQVSPAVDPARTINAAPARRRVLSQGVA